MTALVLRRITHRRSLQPWLQLLAVCGALALLLIGLPGASVAQTRPDGQPSARPQDTQRTQRPAAQKPSAQRKTPDPGDRSADELTRQYNERLQAEQREADARAAEEGRRQQEGQRGFLGRLFDTRWGGSSQTPPAPKADDQVAQARPPAAPPAAAPTTPDQLAQQQQPPQPTPPAQPRQPVPTPTPTPPLITPPPPPPGAVPPPGPGAPPVDEARSRPFGRSSVVPTEQPTLSVDAGKGTIIKLRSPASTVFIANPDIADVQVKTGGTIYIFGKKPGETVLYAVDEQDRVLLNTVVLVGHPVGRVISNVSHMPGGSTIQATTVGGSVVLQGRSDNPGAIENARRMAVGVTGDPAKVINNVALDGPNQVLLRVKIVEIQRETLKRLGINWEAVFRISGNLTAGLATPVDLVTQPFTRINAPAGGVIAGRYTGGGNDILGLIDLLATENMLTVLAEPNLVAVSGETASFLAGGEFPIVVPQGNASFIVQFKQFGVSLAFTPTIHANGRISLRAKPEVSQLSTNGQVNFSGFTIPALTTRRVDTTVELGSGQSFAIAGLIQNNATQDISKLPGLGDIPILGALFKSDAFRRQESELVVIVTPYLVRASNRPLATPVDGNVPPTDADRYLYGRTHRQQGAGTSTVRAGGRTQAGGFMLE